MDYFGEGFLFLSIFLNLGIDLCTDISYYLCTDIKGGEKYES
nr:MAG TPA: hypothetical protein [Bacteriophage sp.]